MQSHTLIPSAAAVSAKQKHSSKGAKKELPRKEKKIVLPGVFHGLWTDKNVNYYIGVKSKLLLQVIHDYVQGDGKVSPNAKTGKETLARRHLLR